MDPLPGRSNRHSVANGSPTLRRFLRVVLPSANAPRWSPSLVTKGLLRYGTELFSALYSSKNIPYRSFVPCKNTVRNSRPVPTVRNFFRTVISFLSVPLFFNQFRSRKTQQETFAIAIYLFSCIFVLLSRESDQSAIRARLGVASHLSATQRWGNPAKCLSHQHNK